MSAASTVRQYAESQRNKRFSATWDPQHGHIKAYCAAYVRWCFLKAGITLPVVMNPESYRRLGLSYVGDKLTADGFAGKAVGEMVPKGMMPGDILLFRNTYSEYPIFGTITHVGIAADSRGMMYDAGSGSLVHRRHHEDTFPGLLVEVRRPLCLGGTTHAASASGLSHRLDEAATRIHFDGGPVSAKLKGKAVRDIMVTLHADGRCAVNGQPVKAGVVSLVIHDVSGALYKMHMHHHRSMMTGGAKTIVLELRNGLLQVGYADGNSQGSPEVGGRGSSGAAHVGPSAIGSMAESAMSGSGGGSGASAAAKVGRPSSTAGAMLKKIGQIGEQATAALAKKVGVQLHPLKPTSVELTILH